MAVGSSLLGILLVGVAGSGGDCPPIAVLHGEAQLIGVVGEALHDRGIRTHSVGVCRPVLVLVESNGAEFVLAIMRPEGTAVARAATGPSEAATIIESYVRTDVVTPLLEHELPPDVRSPFPTPPSDRPAAVVTEVPPAGPRSFVLSAGGLGAVGGDASSWIGVDARACVLLWHFCLGGRVQYALDLNAGGDATRLNGERQLLEIGATLDLPFVVGPFEIAPGLGAGYSRLLTEREIDAALQLDKESSDETLRLRAQFGVSWRFADYWSLRVDGALDGVPGGGGDIVEDGIELPGQPSFLASLRLGLEAGGF